MGGQCVELRGLTVVRRDELLDAWALKNFPPPAADQPLFDELAAVGVGPGLKPSERFKRGKGVDDAILDVDGSLDLYLQSTPPSDPEQLKNWLPTPAGAFNLLFRLYGPHPEAVPGILSGTGWKAPTILPCLPSGFTATGRVCPN